MTFFTEAAGALFLEGPAGAQTPNRVLRLRALQRMCSWFFFRLPGPLPGGPGFLFPATGNAAIRAASDKQT
jgi:hypothetical protein